MLMKEGKKKVKINQNANKYFRPSTAPLKKANTICIILIL